MCQNSFMKFAHIPFVSIDQKDQKYLTYELYSHPIAERWRGIVERSQKLGASYANSECFYGGGFYSVEELSLRIQNSLNKTTPYFQELWSQSVFNHLRDKLFSPTQENANIAHVFFETAFNSLSEEAKAANLDLVDHLNTLNKSIHQLESQLHNPDGFFVDISLWNSFRGDIQAEENQFFSLDKTWGELFLTYCHIGEGYLQAMNAEYPIAPTPQTKVSGNIILYFDSTYKYQEMERLQNWLNKLTGKEVNVKDLPVGEVPLAKIIGDWTPESIHRFFKAYPKAGEKIIFSNRSNL